MEQKEVDKIKGILIDLYLPIKVRTKDRVRKNISNYKIKSK